MKITVEQLEDLGLEGGIISFNGVQLELIEEGEWEQDDKFQSKEIIFSDGNKFYRGYIGRSGSPFSYWTYDSEIYGANDPADITEVEKKEVVVTKWVSVS